MANAKPEEGRITLWRAPVPIFAAVFLLPLLTTCSQPPPAVGQAFATRATAVCETALKAKQAWSAFPVENFDPAHPDPSAFPKVAVWLEDQVAPTFEAWLNGLEGLGDPPTSCKAWSGVLAAVAKIVQGNADEIAAARAGDTEAFVAARDRLAQTQTELESATAAAGVAKCADVDEE